MLVPFFLISLLSGMILIDERRDNEQKLQDVRWQKDHQRTNDELDQLDDPRLKIKNTMKYIMLTL